MVSTISASTLRDRIDDERNLTVVDTRPAEDFAEWHIPGAENYPYNPDDTVDLDAFQEDLDVDSDDPIVTICALGKSSHALANLLQAAGYGDVSAVEAGMRAWSAVYDHVPISVRDVDGALEIVQLQRRAKGCLGYLVVGDDAAAAVDVSRHGEEWLDAAADRDVPITVVLDTHVHADHISGGRMLADDLGVPYYLPDRSSERGVQYDHRTLSRNEVITIGGIPLKAISTPGHTSDSTSYLLGAGAVLTGDTLFVDSVGRTELQFGDGNATDGADALYDSLHRTLLAEPDSVTVLPGHMAIEPGDDESGSSANGWQPGDPVSTTIGELRRDLDVLSRGRDAFIRTITARLPEKPPNYDTVIDINLGRDQPADEDDAIELELGPNRCAADLDVDVDAD